MNEQDIPSSLVNCLWAQGGRGVELNLPLPRRDLIKDVTV